MFLWLVFHLKALNLSSKLIAYVDILVLLIKGKTAMAYLSEYFQYPVYFLFSFLKKS